MLKLFQRQLLVTITSTSTFILCTIQAQLQLVDQVKAQFLVAGGTEALECYRNARIRR